MATATVNTTNSFPNESAVVFLMVPFPSQSHLNQLLRLSQLIHSRGFPVHYAASDVHCRQVKLRHDSVTSSSGIIFHELLTTPFNSPLPPPPPQQSIKFPKHLWNSFGSSLNSREPVAALVRELSSLATTRRLVIIHDNLMNYAVQDSASVPNAESYSFNCISAFCTLYLSCQFSGKPFPIIDVKPDANAILTVESCFPPEMLNFWGIQSEFEHITHGQLYSTCRAMEGPYLDIVTENDGIEKKHWAIAPLFTITATYNEDDKVHPTLEWLDKQPPKSVIYVSFGSNATMSQEQITELALGLEQSKQSFLWVLRVDDADTGDIFHDETRIFQQLPEGFEERVKGVGKVTRDWAPQLRILRHPSVGGFMSHCGWNSCLESLTMGVPLATWPLMQSDQPLNALLVTDTLKVGVPVISWGEQDEVVTSSTIKKSIESLMRSNEGDEVRRRVEDLGEAIRKSVDDDHWEFNSFLAYVAR